MRLLAITGAWHRPVARGGQLGPPAWYCLVVPWDGSDGWCRTMVRGKRCPLAEMSVEFKDDWW
jgi:hypothetical protein